MASVSVLNKIAKSTYTRFDDLEIGKEYPIKKYDIFVDTVYHKGNCIRAWIEDMGYVILPSRFNSLVEDDDDYLTLLNREKMSLVFNGRKGNSVDIEFKPQKQQQESNKK